MIKYLFILINALTIFIYSLFGGDNGITVSSNIPKTIKSSQEVPIEIKVTKGAMSGFAKLQLELPEGLSLKEVDNKGANYSYSDGVAKWVWASLPNENDILIKATLVATSGASGSKTIGAKYSFVENNTKQVVEMVPIEVTIETNGAAKNETAVPTNAAAVTEANTQTTAVNSNKEPAGNITVVRIISKGASESEYIVNLKIKKGSTRGFARYSDDLMKGVVAKAINTDGSSFSVADGKVKFVWVSVLMKEELELSYSLTSAVSVAMILKGEYSYLEDNQSKKFLLNPEPLNITINQAVATSTTEPVNTQTVAVVVPTETHAVVPTETVAVVVPTKIVAVVVPTETLPAAVVTPTETPVTVVETVAKNDGNVNYMVQIGAFTNANVSASALKQKFRISETVKSEMHQGFSKFMIGSHGQYKGARNQRENLRNNNGVKGAFVVAYNQSKRITVQEALMISNQKWYK